MAVEAAVAEAAAEVAVEAAVVAAAGAPPPPHLAPHLLAGAEEREGVGEVEAREDEVVEGVGGEGGEEEGGVEVEVEVRWRWRWWQQ